MLDQKDTCSSMMDIICFLTVRTYSQDLDFLLCDYVNFHRSRDMRILIERVESLNVCTYFMVRIAYDLIAFHRS